MKNINLKKLKLDVKIRDPIRYPKVTEKYEAEAKKEYKNMLQDTYKEIVQKMVELKK